MKQSSFQKIQNKEKRKNGIIAEDKAAFILRKKGYDILARNVRFFGIEIDFIVKKKVQDEYHYFFFEVKKTKQEHYYAGYKPFSIKQYKRYCIAIEKWHAELNKVKNSHIGLLLFNERSELIEYNPFYIQPTSFSSGLN
ncbi:MAG: YraN family protein [Spirochaetia bacterium]|nr:YraN family protein [Spirochaetia bacterium]